MKRCKQYVPCNKPYQDTEPFFNYRNTFQIPVWMQAASLHFNIFISKRKWSNLGTNGNEKKSSSVRSRDTQLLYERIWLMCKPLRLSWEISIAYTY